MFPKCSDLFDWCQSSQTSRYISLDESGQEIATRQDFRVRLPPVVSAALAPVGCGAIALGAVPEAGTTTDCPPNHRRITHIPWHPGSVLP